MDANSKNPEAQGCLPSFLRGLVRLLAGGGGGGGEADPGPHYPYDQKIYLLTKAERAFFGVLCQCIAPEQQIFSKVRLEDLIYVRKGTEERQGYRNRIKSRHIDFLICDKTYVRPLLAIELDDKSHNTQRAIKRDTFVDGALESAGLPLLRVGAARTYDASLLSRTIREHAKRY